MHTNLLFILRPRPGRAVSLLLAMLLACSGAGNAQLRPAEAPADSIREATRRAWAAYVTLAWPHDNLLPISGGYDDWYDDPLYISPIDNYSALRVMGLEEEAGRIQRFVTDTLSFDKNVRAKVFEVNIRILGGLLAMYEWTGDARVLAKARDFGDRLLPAFDSPTGLPYYYVNLRTGAAEGPIVNVAEAGSYLFEFGLLSYFTENPTYYRVAKRATRALYERRSAIDLLGRDVNVETGEWTVTASMVGCFVDSYYEYLYKAYRMFGDPELLTMWNTLYPAIGEQLAETVDGRTWYPQVDMHSGEVLSRQVTLWDAYFPALLTLTGELTIARSAQEAWHTAWNRHGIIPQVYDYGADTVVNPYYQLNPEVIESNYHLWHYTGDSTYYHRALAYWDAIDTYCRTELAHAHLKSVVTKEQDDVMATFFIAETLKYLYLTFATDSPVNPDDYVFSTEAHAFRRDRIRPAEASRRLGFPALRKAMATDSIHMGDPFALRVDSTYYLYGTRNTNRGFEVYRSEDLQRWDSLGYAFERSDSSFAHRALWAPEVLAYGGKYYMTYSAVGPVDSLGFQLCLAVADDPAGPYRDLRAPWLTWPEWKTIDAHLFVDDGTPYLYFNRVGIKGEGKNMYGIVYVVELSPDLLQLVSEPVEVVRSSQPWEAADPQYNSNANEGAFVFREGDTYYLTYSSGHYKSPRYGIGVATAPHPLGPWTKLDSNPLLSTDAGRGISGPGHCSIVTTPAGQRYLVYHVHADPEQPGPDRTVRIEQLHVSPQGLLRVGKR